MCFIMRGEAFLKKTIQTNPAQGFLLTKGKLGILLDAQVLKESRVSSWSSFNERVPMFCFTGVQKPLRGGEKRRDRIMTGRL